MKTSAQMQHWARLGDFDDELRQVYRLKKCINYNYVTQYAPLGIRILCDEVFLDTVLDVAAKLSIQVWSHHTYDGRPSATETT